MGGAKRRKLSGYYGITDINKQLEVARNHIKEALASAEKCRISYLYILCCNNEHGFNYDTIRQMQEELRSQEIKIKIPTLIQMLPSGFKSSETKLFDGYVTVWCNSVEDPIWDKFRGQSM